MGLPRGRRMAPGGRSRVSLGRPAAARPAASRAPGRATSHDRGCGPCRAPAPPRRHPVCPAARACEPTAGPRKSLSSRRSCGCARSGWRTWGVCRHGALRWAGTGAQAWHALLDATLVLVADSIVRGDVVEELLREVAAREVVLQRRAELLAAHDAVVAGAVILKDGDDLDVLRLRTRVGVESGSARLCEPKTRACARAPRTWPAGRRA